MQRPNVIGAAAVGFVWKNATASRAVEQRHGRAMLAFSMATLALHGFVIAAWLPVMFGWPWAVAALAGAAVVAAAAERRTPAVALGVAVTLVSLGCFAYWQKDARLWALDLPLPDRLGPRDLLLTAPAIAFGFLACPHLDLTLHRARRHTSPPRRPHRVPRRIRRRVRRDDLVLADVRAAAAADVLAAPGVHARLLADDSLAIHIAAQAALTTGLHLREVKRRGGPRGLILGALFAAMGVALGLTLLPVDVAGVESTRLGFDEIAYRLFLLLYGLPFPVYVLLFLTPVGKRATPRLRGWVALAATGLGAPFAVLGMVTEETRWLLGVYGIVLVAAAVVWWRPQPAREEAAALSPIEKGSSHGV